jgi:hypothetical protein
MGMLAMNVYQLIASLAQLRERGNAAINKSATPSIAFDDTF